MKLKAKLSFKQLEGIFQKGDIVTLETVRYQEDTVIVPILYGGIWHTGDFVLFPADKIVDVNKLPKGVYKFSDAVIASKGSAKAWHIITEDGRRYSTDTIRNAIGYKPLSELFDKV